MLGSGLGVVVRAAYLVGATWLALCMAVACGTDSSADRKRLAEISEGCLINSDCQSPLVCAFKRCHTQCEYTRDCPAGERCVPSDRPFNVCLLEDETACVYNTDCPAEHLFCAKDLKCREQCRSFRDCLSDQVCTEGACADKDELGQDGKLPDPGTQPDAGVGLGCVYNSDCPALLVCKAGSCLPECKGARDCPSGSACKAGSCQPGGAGGDGGGAVPSCKNDVLDTGETQVDCGACDGSPCTKPSDCASQVCQGLTCAKPSCADGLQNGLESDVDCGGGTCPKCPPQKGCWNTQDCANGTCAGGVCTSPGCKNKLKDGNETDVDCGGSDCSPCATGTACLLNSDCASKNCVGNACVPAGPTAWTKPMSQVPVPPEVAFEANGDLVVAGEFGGSFDFGGGTLKASSGDWFIARYTSAGAHVWSRRIGGSGYDYVEHVGTDAQGNILVVGRTTAGGSFGGPTLSCDNALVVAKYSGVDGTHIWSKCPDGPGGHVLQGLGATIADNGDVIVGGSFYGTIDFDGTVITSPWDNGFLARFSGVGGAITWAQHVYKSSSPSTLSKPTTMAADSSGLYVAGELRGTVDFGNGVSLAVGTGGGSDVFLVKLKDDGTALLGRAIGDSAQDAPVALVETGQDLVLTGTFGSQVDFGAGAPITSQGLDDIFLLRIKKSDLSTTWAKAFGGSKGDAPTGVAVSPNGEIALAGTINTTVNFGAGPVKYDSGTDFFLARFALSDASHQASNGWGAFGADLGGSVAYAGNVLAFTAYYTSSGVVDLGTGPLPAKNGAVVALFP